MQIFNKQNWIRNLIFCDGVGGKLDREKLSEYVSITDLIDG